MHTTIIAMMIAQPSIFAVLPFAIILVIAAAVPV